MKIRLVGPAEDCAATVETLRRVLDVLDVSRPYPSRRSPSDVRVYLEAVPASQGHDIEAGGSSAQTSETARRSG